MRCNRDNGSNNTGG
jgi:hypothetical protein